jgi:hypothetical protein
MSVAIEAAMTLAAPQDPADRARERLQQSRMDIVSLVEALRGSRRRDDDAFPRSFIMRAATGRGGRLIASGAALGLVLARPGLLPIVGRLIPWAPLVPMLGTVLNRYLVRRKNP